MSMVCGLDLHRRSDHLRRPRGGVRGGVAGSDLEAGPSAVPALARERGRSSGRRTARSKIAVEGCTGWRYVVEEIDGGRVRSARGGAGRHPGDAGAQEARQDRSHRRPAAAGSAGGRGASRVVDPARTGAGVAGTHAAVQEPGGSAGGVGAADPRRAVPARRGAARGAASARSAPASCCWAPTCSCPTAARQRIRVGYRMIDAVHAEAEALRDEVSSVRSQAAGVPGADRSDLRVRADRGGDRVVRARRLPTLHPVPPGGAPHRPGRHRRRVRHPTRWRLPVPAGPGHVALGAVRSRPVRVAGDAARTGTTTGR